MEREPRFEFKAWQYGGAEVSLSISAESDLEETLTAFKQWLMAVGYDHGQVEEIQFKEDPWTDKKS